MKLYFLAIFACACVAVNAEVLHSFSLPKEKYEVIEELDGKKKTCSRAETNRIVVKELGEKAKYAKEICWLFCAGDKKCKYFFVSKKNMCRTFKTCDEKERQ